MCDHDNLASSFGKLFLRMHRLFDRRMAESGASFARTKLLLFIQKEGGGRAADIASYLGQAPRTVTEAIDGLERDGLVRRAPDPNDRRVKRVTITPEGEEAVRATEPMRKRLVDEIFGVLDEEESVRLRALLAKLSDAVDGLERD
jgi:DNA-binding MarR family transcriptional regulator